MERVELATMLFPMLLSTCDGYNFLDVHSGSFKAPSPRSWHNWSIHDNLYRC